MVIKRENLIEFRTCPAYYKNRAQCVKKVQHVLNNPLPTTIDFIEPEADHRMRHQKALRQQMHKLERSQHQLNHELRQLKAHHIENRLASLETEQKRMAHSTINLSREVASLDKMHGSMLELLEDVEAIQTKYDTAMPDVRREISKLEFNYAQLNSEQGLVREEGRNRSKNIQAIAVSVSALQADRQVIKALEDRVATYELDLRRVEQQQQKHYPRNPIAQSPHQDTPSTSDPDSHASELVHTLERIESEYESLVNHLPDDCSQVQAKGSGYFLIAPQGQQHPVMVRCQEEWTTRRCSRISGSLVDRDMIPVLPPRATMVILKPKETKRQGSRVQPFS